MEPKTCKIYDSIKNKKDICIIMPTFNQYEQTKKNIELLKEQTLVPDIIIVDNNSSDWTFTKLQEEFDDIILIKSKDNYWGSGWFYIWQKYAYEQWYEWLILNDNDAYPVDENLIENLFKNSKINLSAQPFNILMQNKFNKNHIFTFHYNIYHKSIIDKIWFVDYRYFIYFDDVDYLYNSKKYLSYKKIENKYQHLNKNFQFPKMFYFLFRNFLFFRYKNFSFINFYFHSIITYYWLKYLKFNNLHNYCKFAKKWWEDFFNFNFELSNVKEILNKQADLDFRINKISITEFKKKCNDKWYIYSIQNVLNWHDLYKYFDILPSENVFSPRKEVFYKNIVTTYFNNVYRLFLLFFSKDVIFIKDINFKSNEIEYFKINNNRIKSVLFFILSFPFIALYLFLKGIVFNFKYGKLCNNQ